MKKGVYTCSNVPEEHPLACLNKGFEGKISYGPIDDTDNPIIIKVSDGSSTISGNDYFTFKDANDNNIAIGGGGFKFMRGRTYKFQANGINFGMGFKVFMNGAFINNNDNDTNGITGSSDSITMHIPYNHSTTAGDLYYESKSSTTIVSPLDISSGVTAGAGFYRFNDATIYESKQRYSLENGIYTLVNVPVTDL